MTTDCYNDADQNKVIGRTYLGNVPFKSCEQCGAPIVLKRFELSSNILTVSCRGKGCLSENGGLHLMLIDRSKNMCVKNKRI
jgi:hypothetical protein